MGFGLGTRGLWKLHSWDLFKSMKQSTNQPYRNGLSLAPWVLNIKLNQPMDQSTNQSPTHSNTQSITQPINHWTATGTTAAGPWRGAFWLHLLQQITDWGIAKVFRVYAGVSLTLTCGAIVSLAGIHAEWHYIDTNHWLRIVGTHLH